MRNGSRRTKKGSLAEFPITLIVLIVFITLPLINLIGIAAGAGIAYLITQKSAMAAASQQNYDLALSAMEKQSLSQSRSLFARWLGLKPKGGFNNCGVDLYVLSTNWADKSLNTQFGPNMAVPPPVDIQSNIYQCSARSFFDVGPAIPMNGIPWLGTLAGIGKPVRLSFTVDRMAEHPSGLEAGSGALTSKLPVPYSEQASSSTHTTGKDGSGWDFPDIYKSIEAAGQTAVDESVLVVKADNPSWTPTGLNITRGQKVWLDCKADGTWQIAVDGGRKVTTDANGDSSARGKFASGALICATDSTAPAAMPVIPETEPEFFLGKQVTSFQAQSSGNLYLGAYELGLDNYHNSTGSMTVRIVVAQPRS